VRPDPGRDLQEAMIATMPLEGRVAVMTQMRAKGMQLVWQQSDEHGPMTEPERAMFLIDRLYPEMPPQHREQFRRRFEELWEAGTWHGFQRPAPLASTDDR
jgi:hypothetical protein